MRPQMRPVTGVPGVDFTLEDVRGAFPDELEIEPLARPVDATVRVPGSKSVTNRALLIAALANGTSTIRNTLFSDDSYWLMHALVRLGFAVRANRSSGETSITGESSIIPEREIEVYVGNAGTVGRFLPPALALGEGPYVVDSTPRMRERPVGDLVDAMRLLGAGVGYVEEDRRFPLRVEGGGFRGGTARVRAKSSSQFVSGLLMAAPYAREPVMLEVEGRDEWPYVGITEEVMRAFGVEVGRGQARYIVEPGVYQAREFEVEPDAAVVPGRVEDYDNAHPRTALLIVEVADSSLKQDRLTKAMIYAAAGIPEYWIVNVVDQQVEVHRDPDRRARHPRRRRHPDPRRTAPAGLRRRAGFPGR